MSRFAANLSFLYGEYHFPDRFAAAAKDGFTGVEYLFPYDYPHSSWRRCCRKTVWSRYCSTHRREIGQRGSVAWPACPDEKQSSKPQSAAPLPMRKH